jgi:hypothetical protein
MGTPNFTWVLQISEHLSTPVAYLRGLFLQYVIVKQFVNNAVRPTRG